MGYLWKVFVFIVIFFSFCVIFFGNKKIYGLGRMEGRVSKGGFFFGG